MTSSSQALHQGIVRTLAKGYAVKVLMLAGLIPAIAIAYLLVFQDPTLLFEHNGLHELVIGITLVQSGFITYISYRCYRHSREFLLRWLTIGFLGVTVIYGFQGLSARFSDDHLSLFTLSGPVARLVMSACMLAGLKAYGRTEQSAHEAPAGYFWWAWIGAFVLINPLLFLVVASEWATPSRWIIEIAAMGIMLSIALSITIRGLRSPFTSVYAFSAMFLAQAGLAFLLGSSWNHMWWLAHAIFAGGFMTLSYGVIQLALQTETGADQ